MVSVKAGACTLGRSIFPLSFRKNWYLSNLDMRFNSAGSHKVGVRVLGRCIFPVKFRIQRLWRNLDMRFDCEGSRKMCVCILGSIWAAAFFLQISV